MKIICDHCTKDIAGTVKRVPGNFNLHPQCLTELGLETKDESTALSLRGDELSVSTSPVLKASTPGLSLQRN